MLRRFAPTTNSTRYLHPLTTTTLGLQFWLKEFHFENATGGRLRVKCHAFIPDVYDVWTSEVVAAEYTVPHKVLQATSAAYSFKSVKGWFIYNRKDFGQNFNDIFWSLKEFLFLKVVNKHS